MEELYPLNLQPRSPADLRARWAERGSSLPESVLDEEEQEVFDFEERHGLARAVQGMHLPSVWLVREGELFWVSSKKATVLLPACRPPSVFGNKTCTKLRLSIR